MMNDFFSSLTFYVSMSYFSSVFFQGMSMPIAHVEESWQMAEFYSNKVYLMPA